MVLNAFDGIHIGAPAQPLKIFNPLLCKRICNNTCPMLTGIVVLKYGACCLVCSEMWIQNRLKDIVNVTLPCQNLSNNLEIKHVVMTNAAPHHNGSATEHFSLNNNVILKWIMSTSTPYANTPIRSSSSVPTKFVSGPLHTIASRIKRQKRVTASLQSSLVKSPVNSSGICLNIKILPLLTKFRTRSLRIRNSRSHKHSIIGSRRESWSWSVSDVICLAILCK